MRKVTASVLATPVKIVRNTSKGSVNDQWARIVHAKTGEILHTGQVQYIKRTAAKRYNVLADL